MRHVLIFLRRHYGKLAAGLLLAAVLAALWWALPVRPRACVRMSEQCVLLGLSSDAQMFVTCGAERDLPGGGHGLAGPLRLWNVASGTSSVLPLHAGESSLTCNHAFGSPNGTHFAFTTFEPKRRTYFLHIVEIATGEEVLRREVDWLSSVSFSPQGSLVAYTRGVGSGTAFVYDLSARRERFTVCAAQEPWTGSPLIFFSPDGRLLAANRSWRDDGRLTIWDTALGKQLASIENLPAKVQHVAFDASANRLTVICCDHRGYAHPVGKANGPEKPISAIWIKDYDSSTGRELCQKEKQVGSFQLVSATAPVGASQLFLLRETADERVTLDDLTTGRELGQLGDATTENRRLGGTWAHYPGMFDAQMTPTGNILAIVTYPEPNPFWERVEKWLPGMNLSASESHRTIVLYDTTSTKVLCRLPEADDFMFSSDGKHAANYRAADSVVRIWDIPPRKPLGWFLSLAGLLVLLTVAGFCWQARRRKRQAASRAEAV